MTAETIDKTELAAATHRAKLPGPAYFDEIAELMPRADIEAIQEAQILPAIEYAYRHAPLIRATWDRAGIKPADIKSLEDFKALAPFIEKDDIRAYREAHDDASGGLRAGPEHVINRIATSSGTSGDPTPEFLGGRQRSDEGMARDFYHVGMRPGDYYAYPMFTFKSGVEPFPLGHLGFIPIGFEHSPAEVPRLIEASLRYRPVTGFSFSSILLNTFETVFEQTGADPVDVFSSYRGVFAGGEWLSARLKAMTKSWGLNLFELTACGDVGGAFACSAHDGCHVWEDLALYECLHPDRNEPVADGELGELAATSFDPLHPLIRHRSADIVMMKRDQCACGRTHARIKTIGRKGDRTVVNGKMILPSSVHEIVETHRPCRAGLFQIVRASAEMEVLRLRVGYNPDLLEGGEHRLRSDLIDRLTAEIDVPIEVEMTLDAELLKLGPPHKIPRVTKA